MMPIIKKFSQMTTLLLLIQLLHVNAVEEEPAKDPTPSKVCGFNQFRRRLGLNSWLKKKRVARLELKIRRKVQERLDGLKEDDIVLITTKKFESKRLVFRNRTDPTCGRKTWNFHDPTQRKYEDFCIQLPFESIRGIHTVKKRNTRNGWFSMLENGDAIDFWYTSRRSKGPPRVEKGIVKSNDGLKIRVETDIYIDGKFKKVAGTYTIKDVIRRIPSRRKSSIRRGYPADVDQIVESI